MQSDPFLAIPHHPSQVAGPASATSIRAPSVAKARVDYQTGLQRRVYNRALLIHTWNPGMMNATHGLQAVFGANVLPAIFRPRTRRGSSRSRGGTVRCPTAVSGVTSEVDCVTSVVSGVYALVCETGFLTLSTDGHRSPFDCSILARTIQDECEMMVPMVRTPPVRSSTPDDRAQPKIVPKQLHNGVDVAAPRAWEDRGRFEGKYVAQVDCVVTSTILWRRLRVCALCSGT